MQGSLPNIKIYGTQSTNSRKPLGLVLNSKLDSNIHVNNKINKCNKSIGIVKKHSLTLSRNILFTTYKTLVKSVLDYSDVICDRPLTEYFRNKLKMLICIAAFRITCYAHIFNRELGLESLAERRVSRKIFFFRKTINGLFPAYLQLYIS